MTCTGQSKSEARGCAYSSKEAPTPPASPRRLVRTQPTPRRELDREPPRRRVPGRLSSQEIRGEGHQIQLGPQLFPERV